MIKVGSANTKNPIKPSNYRNHDINYNNNVNNLIKVCYFNKM